ncbi:precorrin-3B C(17)-methyltransferase [Clostridium cellulovorans]|uniref:Precorrin-3B C17-methyltransferase n=1 Tax=Clostridium cellulovorans (strain ATCC 35296 / DSM 3052 / OCM 3 / 743B) TaxID=573061 RepID=D9SNZ7_CLOC7|nr:precorrin-3B C(17)-methyltransferase [Clostridium cellulovorans]ADL51962.1 precorrin-3B C17-methyltransferase [Clostridium cellulovorans 743B]
MKKNKLFAVGIGPGGEEHMTQKALKVLEEADIIIGYTAYIELVKKIFPEKEYIATAMKKEIERCKIAVEQSLEGKTVAMVSSGDSGIYGMAGILLQLVNAQKEAIDFEVIPGVTAANAAAAILGAPLMHDFSVISLSDLMTPLDLIMKRVECSAEGDFVICLYNPKSKKRTDYITKAAEIVGKYRSENTPVGIVRNAGREDESSEIVSLKDIDKANIDMFTIVIIGNSQSYIENGKIITPRGYKL